MNGVDWKFLHLVSSRLERFSDKGNDIYNFKCPFCGDSKKNKMKTRGYIFSQSGETRYKCHNCGVSYKFSTFLRLVASDLYAHYKADTFGKSVVKPIDETLFKSSVNFSPEILSLCERLDKPGANSRVLTYARMRKIPERFYDSLYSVANVNKIIERLPQYSDRQVPNGLALAIPFFNKNDTFNWIQFRYISKSSPIRFITLCAGDKTLPKIWGDKHVDWSKRVFVTEGPIDAMSIDNSIAIAGASSNRAIAIIKKLQTEQSVFCYDNDYSKNPDIKKQMEKRIDAGFGVLIYDRWFQWKDINAAVVDGGVSLDAINTYVNRRTFFDLSAKLELSRLAK